MSPKNPFPKLNPNIKALVWPVVVLIVCFSLIILVVLPQLIGYFNTQSEIEQTKLRTAFLNSKASTLQNADIQAFKDSINLTLTALPKEKDIPAAVNQIQTLVSSSKLQLSGINFASNELASKNQSFTIKIDLTGDQGSLRSFITSLNSAPLIMKLTGIDVTGNKNGSLLASLTLSAYYNSNPITLGDVEQPLPNLTASESALIAQLQQNALSLPQVSQNSTSLGPRGKSDPFH